MIDKVVSSIIEAEECAKQMILDAEKNASDVLEEADIIIEQKTKDAAAKNKSYLSNQMQSFSINAKDAAQKYFEENSQIINSEIKAYKANINTAIKKVIAKL